MKIREAKQKDILDLLPLVEEYNNEQGWDWGYDRNNSITTLNNYIAQPDCEVLYIEDDGKKVGAALIAYDHGFHPEKIGHINYFFVSKLKRGTKAGRLLAKACNEWFDFHKCVDCFASATAKIDCQDMLFKNLMGKFGFKDCGHVLARESR